MILEALASHYEDMLEKGLISRPGWGKANITFGLDLEDDGSIISLLPLKVEKINGKKTVRVPRTMDVPQPAKRSVDVNSNFLCDNASYILGIDEKGKPDRTKKCFQACQRMHQELLKDVETSEAKAITAYFTNWDPEKAKEKESIFENWDELVSGGNLVFYYHGRPVTEDKKVQDSWQQYYDNNQLEGGEKGTCIVTGKKAKIAKLHPIIKGVRGGQAMGTSLVSFNAPAFCSYGKEQGDNASVSEYAAFAYATALNSLLSDSERVRAIGDTTVVCWVEGGDTKYQDVSNAAMFGAEEEGITNQDLTMILDKIQNMDLTELQIDDIFLDLTKHFYVLGITPSAARLSVRFFYTDSFGNMLRNIAKHYKRLEIIKPCFDKFEQLPIWKLVSETVNQNTKDKTPSPQMAVDVMQAVLSGRRYPASLLNGVMLRIRSEKEIDRGRAAIIKAYYLQNKNNQCPEEVLQVSLNENSTDIPYTLGRLFSILEQIQQEANPGINTTIKDKYFNTAASTPAQVFPVLINLAQKHVRKLTEGKKIYFNKQIGNLAEKIGEDFPKRMTLPQQGGFQLGYYCQTQERFQKKEEK